MSKAINKDKDKDINRGISGDMKKEVLCVDCGSENCPCYLALEKECIMCGKLNGKDCNECKWNGVCIYNEYLQGGQKVNNPRHDIFGEIISRKEYEKGIEVFEIYVGKGFAMRCSTPGSYLFLRNPEKETFFQAPISVMCTDIAKGTVTVAVQQLSSKSKSLLEAQKGFMVRGVYRNGIIGIGDVLKSEDPVLIIAKGMAAAPLGIVLEFLNRKRAVEVYLDSEKLSAEFKNEYLMHKYSKYTKETPLNELIDTSADIYKKEGYEHVQTVVLASDYYINRLRKVIKIDAYSNNFRLCCGEGICGSCEKTNAFGEKMKMCKCQLAADEIFE